MNKNKRQLIYDKFNGLCAYTGKPLGDDWQVDHVISKNWSKYYKDTSLEIDENHIDNLFPALRIVNHYKRAFDLEGFRQYMLRFHLRLAKLPKTTRVNATEKRKEYMYKVADAFDIRIDKPFSGIFYFETLILK